MSLAQVEQGWVNLGDCARLQQCCTVSSIEVSATSAVLTSEARSRPIATGLDPQSKRNRSASIHSMLRGLALE